MNSNKLKSQIGRLIVTGWDQPNPSEEFLRFVSEASIGGVILFEENCGGSDQVRESIKQVSDQLDFQPLVAIDQEGGRVCRIKGAPAEYVSAAEVGRKNDLERYHQEFGRSTVFMESLGINTVLGPVADIFLDPENSCLEGRCFGEDAGTVALFVAQGVEIIKQAGMLSCLKHFPGLGAATIDPHEATTEANYDFGDWSRQEKIPFEDGIARGADLVMTTHLSLPKIDTEIVTASHKIVREMLRDELHFEGAVITDDLTMNGADGLGDYGERTLRAFTAGHDILLFGRNWQAAREGHEALTRAFDQGKIAPDRLRRSLDRIAALGHKLDHRSVITNGSR